MFFNQDISNYAMSNKNPESIETNYKLEIKNLKFEIEKLKLELKIANETIQSLSKNHENLVVDNASETLRRDEVLFFIHNPIVTYSYIYNSFNMSDLELTSHLDDLVNRKMIASKSKVPYSNSKEIEGWVITNEGEKYLQSLGVIEK